MKSAKGPICSEQGFTFNEILVAISVIVVVILGFSLNTVGVIRGNFESKNITVAVNLAQDKVEQLKVEKKLSDVNLCPDSGDRFLTATGTPGGIYHRCWSISDSPLGKNLKRIDVTVSWRDYESRHVTISTLVFTD